MATNVKIRRRARRRNGGSNYTLKNTQTVAFGYGTLSIHKSRKTTRKRDVRFSQAH